MRGLEALDRAGRERIRDQPINVLDKLVIGLFSVELSLRVNAWNPAWLTNICDSPYMRESRKDHRLQRLGVHSLIHADVNVGSLQARLGQLISIIALGELSYAVFRKQLERSFIVSQISCFIRSCSSAT